MICGALALHLDQDPHVGQVSPSPLVEGGEELQSVRAGTDINIHAASVLRRSLKNKICIRQ